MRINLRLSVLALLIGSNLWGQSSYRFGSIPSLNLNTELAKGWGLNFKSEFRSMFRQGLKDKTPLITNEYIHTDLSALVSKKVGLGNRLTGGFLLRIRDNRVIQRYIQQYILVRNYDGYRMSYRFALDETFDDLLEVRFRLRTSTEIPLNGKKVDDKEYYIKLNQEILNNFEASIYDIELRLIPLLGYKLNDNNKVEFGIDYRLDTFLNNEPRHTALVSMNWFLKI